MTVEIDSNRKESLLSRATPGNNENRWNRLLTCSTFSEENLDDLDHQVDAYIREQVKMKRRLDEVEATVELAK
jgi:hypothetical protein